ncbi:MAG: hypothetical protein QOF73_34 [Thermomicrobiales bacterium]|jgi:hypothetical protein|nr:hypothetical protein [Thermomicrobiales bacterium]
MPPSDDFVTAMAHDVRSAVTAASARLQFSVRRIERGNVDLGRLIVELRDLDVHVRRVCDLVAAIEATTPIVVTPHGAAEG